MTLRDKRQHEFADQWMMWRFGILYLCPRFGKIYTTINILKMLPPDIDILIAYPDREIEKSWKADFKKREYTNKNITYTTHLSLHKYVENVYDIVIIDEIHLLSEAQIAVCKEMFMLNREVLGLTGTLSMDTEQTMHMELGLKVLAYYPIETGIAEGVVTDYQITVFKVPLDDIKRGMFKNPARTEKKQFNALSWVINQKTYAGENSMFLRLSRMRIIQNSIAKRNKTIKILRDHKDERILVFCGTTKVADSLGIVSHHSKNKNADKFQEFTEGNGENHIAVVKIGNSGVTYKPLNKVIINYFDSNAENMAQKINRCMGMEYDTPDKKAHIYIICTNEIVEQKWLNKALEFFDNEKIKYL
jgi:superfamily II DNA or RNA helicase